MAPETSFDVVVALEREILSRQEHRLIAGDAVLHDRGDPVQRHGHVTETAPLADVPIEEVDLRQ
jgi:hypothetical protein